MNGIIAMTELALDSDLSVEQRDYLETVKISADALLRTINGILDYSKIEARDFTIEPARFVLCQVVSALLQRTRLAAREKGLKLSCDIDPDIPRKLIGDGPRLQQVLFNLIENAIKFTCAGQVTLSAQLEAWTSGACRIRFAVTDTGIGISSDHLNLIFQPFRQVDGSTTRRYGGTGLGLTICSQLVASMGGEISVQSKPGEGSTFEFALEFPAEAEVEVCCCQLVEAIE
jgi:two-component system, sensor histidine kinase and response regulator